MKTLSLYNFDHNRQVPLDLQQRQEQGQFVLKTCQRQLILSIGEMEAEAHQLGTKAYAYMLEMLCGLKSRLLAEHEIVAQFKQALEHFLNAPHRNEGLVPVLQKLLQDSKNIRTTHLKGIGQRTYAGITRKLVKQYAKDENAILIYGTGQLAQDLLQSFKKTHKVYLTGRNPAKMAELMESHEFTPVAWQDTEQYLNFKIHLNTIGTETQIFAEDFTDQLAQNEHLIVDLAQPSPFFHIQSKKYFGLRDIYDLGVIAEEHKIKKVQAAKNAIAKKATDRAKWFQEQDEKKSLFLKENHGKVHHRDQGQPIGQSPSRIYTTVS